MHRRLSFILSVALCALSLPVSSSQGVRADWPPILPGPIETDDGIKAAISEVSKDTVAASKESPLPSDFISNAESLLSSDKHRELSLFLAPRLSHSAVISWLTEKSRQGWIPAMWNLSDAFASSEPLRSLEWGYTAIILTRAEAYNCSVEHVSRSAAAVISGIHPRIQRVSRVNPYYAGDAYAFAFDFVDNLTSWPASPAWLCGHPSLEAYGSANLRMAPEKEWNVNRRRGIADLRESLLRGRSLPKGNQSANVPK